MKSLTRYIIEGLKNEYKKWLQNVLNSQLSLVKDNKVQPLNIDIQNLNKPEKSFLYDDFINDPIVKKIIGNKQTGFVVTNQIIRNPNQYIKDEDKKFNSECLPYWYQDGNNIYMVGICIYDKTVSYVDDFVHIISIESSLAIEDSNELNKAIVNDFIKFIQKDNNVTGLSAKPKHPKMKAILQKIGFNELEDNKEILTYKYK